MFRYKKNIALVNLLEKKKKCKRSSCRTYASVLMRIHREFSKKKFNINLKWLSDDASSILGKIKKLASVNIQRNLIGTGLVALGILARHLDQIFERTEPEESRDDEVRRAHNKTEKCLDRLERSRQA